MIRLGSLSRLAVVRVLVLGLGVLSLAACRQGIGDRCQLTSDCQDCLICVLPVGGTTQSGGVCQANGNLDMTANIDYGNAPDQLTVVHDLSTSDAGPNVDGATPADLTAVDAL